jgi:hypothetical protein
MKLCIEKGLSFDPVIGLFTMIMLQLILSVRQFMAQKLITEIEHPPCSPGLDSYVSMIISLPVD